MTPGSHAPGHRQSLSPSGSRWLLHSLTLLLVVLAGLLMDMAWRAADGLPTAQASELRTLLLGAVSLLGGGVLVCVAYAAVAMKSFLRAAPPHDEPPATRAPVAAARAGRGTDTSGWTSYWPSGSIPGEQPGQGMPTTDGTQSDQAGEAAPTPARTGASLAGAGGDARAEGGLERAAEWMTEASRTLTREADELNACSLDLSALANGTLRDAATADAAARAAQLQASAALIAAGRELSADRAGREELEACVIQAHLLRQLVLELLAAASNSTPTPATALCPVAENAGLAGHAPERRWAPLGAECLQAVDRLTETAAEGRLHLKAAEQAAASRRQTLELLSQELHGLATASSSVVRMTSSQVDYGHTIAHLGARLALGMTCLNEDLQKNLRCE